MVALDRLWPIMSIDIGSWRWISSIPIVLGVALAVWGVLTFRHHRTRVHPGQGHATTVVTTGPYRFTRNPMYLGMMLILVGGAVRLGSLTPWFVLPIFGIAISRLWIRREERWLSEAFGEAYEQYRSRIRRWI